MWSNPNDIFLDEVVRLSPITPATFGMDFMTRWSERLPKDALLMKFQPVQIRIMYI